MSEETMRQSTQSMADQEQSANTESEKNSSQWKTAQLWSDVLPSFGRSQFGKASAWFAEAGETKSIPGKIYRGLRGVGHGLTGGAGMLLSIAATPFTLAADAYKSFQKAKQWYNNNKGKVAAAAVLGLGMLALGIAAPVILGAVIGGLAGLGLLTYLAAKIPSDPRILARAQWKEKHPNEPYPNANERTLISMAVDANRKENAEVMIGDQKYIIKPGETKTVAVNDSDGVNIEKISGKFRLDINIDAQNRRMTPIPITIQGEDIAKGHFYINGHRKAMDAQHIKTDSTGQVQTYSLIANPPQTMMTLNPVPAETTPTAAQNAATPASSAPPADPAPTTTPTPSAPQPEPVSKQERAVELETMQAHQYTREVRKNEQAAQDDVQTLRPTLTLQDIAHGVEAPKPSNDNTTSQKPAPTRQSSIGSHQPFHVRRGPTPAPTAQQSVQQQQHQLAANRYQVQQRKRKREEYEREQTENNPANSRNTMARAM